MEMELFNTHYPRGLITLVPIRTHGFAHGSRKCKLMPVPQCNLFPILIVALLGCSQQKAEEIEVEQSIPLRFKGYWLPYSRVYESRPGTILLKDENIFFGDGGERNYRVHELKGDSVFLELDKPIDGANFILLGPISGWDEELQSVTMEVTLLNKADRTDVTIIQGVEYNTRSWGVYFM